MLRAVDSEEIRPYLQLVQKLARRYVNPAVMAEWDDLVQEGLIAVWQSLQDGQPPSDEYIQLYMRQWVRKCWRLRRGDTVAAENLYTKPEIDTSRSVHPPRD